MKLRIALLFVAVLLAGCARSSVTVQNESNLPLTKIEIRIAGNRLDIDRIDPGQASRVKYSPETEDTFEMSFAIGSIRKQCSSQAYVSPPFDDEFSVRVSGSGSCLISRKNVSS